MVVDNGRKQYRWGATGADEKWSSMPDKNFTRRCWACGRNELPSSRTDKKWLVRRIAPANFCAKLEPGARPNVGKA
jgi:hypothetical protein